ncbi:MAG: helix-turn-helix transcriptional regulator [Candidatus Sericytochromatia bacterium]|nr:helix-turn-helix transcriptional regulator [Candidatus Tanganyikabacteria bacterium]
MPLSRARTLTRLPIRSSADLPSSVRPRSPSIDILKRSLEIAGVTRKQFVMSTGLSYEYVSRIFNAKVKFPTVRETLEKFAEVAEIDPMMFPEYQQLVAVLPESTRKLWNRMQELGYTRQEFASKVDISRTYMYEILRGDVPFPRNPEVIEKIAFALELPPETFGEYLAPVVDWAERNPQAIEHVFLNMLVSKMMVDRGYIRRDDTTAYLLSDELLAIFPEEDRYDPLVKKILQAMGKRKQDIRRLAAEADIDERDLRLLLMGQVSPDDLPEMLKAIKQVLKVR